MARRLPSHLLLVPMLVALLLPLSSLPALQAEQPSLAVQMAPSIPSSPELIDVLEQDTSIRINEVMPKPEAGDFEWVELYNDGFYRLYLPLILRSASGDTSAVTTPASIPATAGITAGPVDIGGWQITDEDGKSYAIPEDLPEVPPGAYVLVIFDELGPTEDDYDFSDGLAVLHTSSSSGLVDIFEDEADQVALYSSSSHSPETIADFVAWGALPGEDAANAAGAGIWASEWSVSMEVGSGLLDGEVPSGRSFGLRPGRKNQGPGDWAVYMGDDLSVGSANPLARAYWTTVGDGETMAADGFGIGWSRSADATYHFQMDDDRAFGSPLIDVILDAPWYSPEELLPAGDYWWRVRAIGPGGDLSEWTDPTSVRISGLEEESGGSVQGQTAMEVETLPNIRWLQQRKDTGLLCLDGCNEEGKEPWDWKHATDDIYEHGEFGCARASVAMIVTRYNGSLSQDRIAYRQTQLSPSMGWPDLGHHSGTPGCNWPEVVQYLLAWALNVDPLEIDFVPGRPDFETIQTWILEGRPILRAYEGLLGNHATVISGYRVRALGAIREVRSLDPWHGAKWAVYTDFLPWTCSWVAPASVPDVRSDEPGVWLDSDGDDIMDWDEETRWVLAENNLNPNNPDTDGDAVLDKVDMREYLFDDTGAPIPPDPDTDDDDLNKEVDPDNDNADNAGSLDGCEDSNRNGRYEPDLGESWNFDPDDENECSPPYFRDDFDGIELDPEKWVYFLNGGTILVEDGTVKVNRGYGQTFPYIYAVLDPFPPGDFVVRTSMRYTSSAGYGTGVQLARYLPVNNGFGCAFDPSIASGLPIAAIWQDSGAVEVAHLDRPLGQWMAPFGEGNPVTVGSAPEAGFHTYETRFFDGIVEIAVDGVKITTSTTLAERPHILWFGNPAVPCNSGYWSGIEMDYIEVSTN